MAVSTIKKQGVYGTMTIDGLTFSGGTYVSGGYARVGNLVIVNIRATKESGAQMYIRGFPAPALVDGVTSPHIPVCIYDASNESTRFGYLNYQGNLTIPGALNSYSGNWECHCCYLAQ